MGYFPPALKSGDTVMVVEPTGGAEYVADATVAHAIYVFNELGINIEFERYYKHKECFPFCSTFQNMNKDTNLDKGIFFLKDTTVDRCT